MGDSVLKSRAGGTRTPNRRFWRPVLYQLSYCPLQGCCGWVPLQDSTRRRPNRLRLVLSLASPTLGESTGAYEPRVAAARPQQRPGRSRSGEAAAIGDPRGPHRQARLGSAGTEGSHYPVERVTRIFDGLVAHSSHRPQDPGERRHLGLAAQAAGYVRLRYQVTRPIPSGELRDNVCR